MQGGQCKDEILWFGVLSMGNHQFMIFIGNIMVMWHNYAVLLSVHSISTALLCNYVNQYSQFVSVVR